MGKIKQLSQHVINQIAAGEVIERPMSVVKEFVENSIDAGATKIEILIENKCLNIRVADNGSGIEEDDLDLAFVKHATSKIEEINDLFNVSTLGFRGEALASIISVSHLACLTKTKDMANGIRIDCENSQIKKSTCACSDGTVMEVKNLFYNIPARLKFLKNDKTELSYITEYIQSAAISHPDISFNLINEKTNILKTSGSGNRLTVISEIYSPSISQQLKELDFTDIVGNIKVSGYTSLPDCIRSSKKSIYIFVNRRVIKCPIIQKAVTNAYKALLPQGKYPFCVIYLEIPPQGVDVNAHPTKKEVRYENPNQIYGVVFTAITRALKLIPSPIPVPYSNFALSFENTNSQVEKNYTQQFFEQPVEEFEQKVFKKSENVVNIEQKTFEMNEDDVKLTQEEFEQPKYRIIGQIANSYIILEDDDFVEFVDQHIAEERYYFEKLQEQKEIASQLLLFDDEKFLEPSDIELLKSNSQKLEEYGYKIEFLSDKSIKFKKIPHLLGHVKTYDILPDLLENLHNAKTDIGTKILATIACHASIKAGQELTLWQMEDVIKRWKSTKQPFTCPHGRPISKRIPKKEIASFFLRNE